MHDRFYALAVLRRQPSRLRPPIIIELDDKSHNREDRKRRDTFLDDALEAAGIKVLHIPAASNYNPAALEQRIRDTIQTTRLNNAAH